MILFKFSNACAIPDHHPDYVILTGGQYTQPKVSKYSKNGWVKDFPPLIVGRGTHACAGYEKRENGVDKMVSIILIFASLTVNHNITISGISGDGRGELPAGQPGAAGHDRGAGGGRDCLETSGETANPSWRPHRSQHEQRNLHDWYDMFSRHEVLNCQII